MTKTIDSEPEQTLFLMAFPALPQFGNAGNAIRKFVLLTIG